MTAENIAEALGGRMAGSCWVAPCPTQGDREPSLSISDGDHGKVLVRCHAGCERERVIAALRSRGLWTGYATAPDGELCGLTVHLPDQCKCGDNHATIGEGRGPHRASLRCPAVCIAAGRWRRPITSSQPSYRNLAAQPRRSEFGAVRRLNARRSYRRHNIMSRKENDMRKHEAYPSTYYNAKDVIDGPILLTIDSVQFEPVGDGTSKKDKPVARFKEEDSKLLVVSATKWDAIALIAKSDDTEGWGGVKIVLEAGKATYQGKLVDSINVRGPKQKSPPKPVVVADELNDEIPY